MNQTIRKLEEIVEREGVDYLHNEPYEVYLELTDAKVCPKNIAGGILLVLLNEILYNDEDIADDVTAFSETISKECGLNERISKYVACILASLYSEENRRKWSGEPSEIEEFLSEDMDLEWFGSGYWYGNNTPIECNYDARFTIRPKDHRLILNNLSSYLNITPPMSCDELTTVIEDEISNYLDSMFDDFLMEAENELNEFLDSSFEVLCPPDEYSPPSADDFNCLMHLNNWCKKNGFMVVSFDGEGSKC